MYPTLSDRVFGVLDGIVTKDNSYKAWGWAFLRKPDNLHVSAKFRIVIGKLNEEKSYLPIEGIERSDVVSHFYRIEVLKCGWEFTIDDITDVLYIQFQIQNEEDSFINVFQFSLIKHDESPKILDYVIFNSDDSNKELIKLRLQELGKGIVNEFVLIHHAKDLAIVDEIINSSLELIIPLEIDSNNIYHTIYLYVVNNVRHQDIMLLGNSTFLPRRSLLKNIFAINEMMETYQSQFCAVLLHKSFMYNFNWLLSEEVETPGTILIYGMKRGDVFNLLRTSGITTIVKTIPHAGWEMQNFNLTDSLIPYAKIGVNFNTLSYLKIFSEEEDDELPLGVKLQTNLTMVTSKVLRKIASIKSDAQRVFNLLILFDRLQKEVKSAIHDSCDLFRLPELRVRVLIELSRNIYMFIKELTNNPLKLKLIEFGRTALKQAILLDIYMGSDSIRNLNFYALEEEKEVEDRIVVFYQRQCIEDLARTIYFSLKRLYPKFKIEITNTLINPNSNILHILFDMEGGPFYLRNFEMPLKYIVYQVEQAFNVGAPVSLFPPIFINIMKNAIRVWDFSPVNCNILKDRVGITNIISFPIPYEVEAYDYLSLAEEFCFNSNLEVAPVLLEMREGYALSEESLEITPILEEVEFNEPIVLIIARNNKRREDLIEQFKIELNKIDKVTKVIWIKDIYGTQRIGAFKAAKIILNIHGGNPSCLEQVRLISALAFGVNIVSERSDDKEMDSLYESVVSFVDYDDIISMAKLCSIDGFVDKRANFPTFLDSVKLESFRSVIELGLSSQNES